jgi:hypothetical protein
MGTWQDRTKQVMQACLATFGETVTYTPDGLPAIEISAIFDQEFQQVDPSTGSLVVSTQPMIGVKEDDLPQKPSKGDRVSIRGIEYRVVDYQPDGQAACRLLLNKL